MSLNIERVVDRAVRGEKALSRRSRFESKHFSLAPSDREMRVFGAVVLAETSWPMSRLKPDFAKRSAVGFEPVGDDALGPDALLFQQTLQQFQRSARVATLLNDEIHDDAFVINSAPKINTLAADVADHFVQMPSRGRSLLTTAQVRRDLRAELVYPTANGFVGDIDAASSEHLFNVSEAEREPEVEPHRVADYVAWIAVAFEGQSRHC